jgi:hypothetical protein
MSFVRPDREPGTSGTGLAPDLAQVVSESIFDIPRLVETARDQRLDPSWAAGRRAKRCTHPSNVSRTFDGKQVTGVVVLRTNDQFGADAGTTKDENAKRKEAL